jgi:hypothetical protein
MVRVKVEVKASFIYIADRKTSACNCRFFRYACFQLRCTTTGTLLLIRHPRRVTDWVDHRNLHTRTHIVIQDARTLCQWSSLPKACTLWCSYCRPRIRIEVSFEPTYKSTRQPHSTTNGRGRQTMKFDGLPKASHTNAHNGIWTRIAAIACCSCKASALPTELNPAPGTPAGYPSSVTKSLGFFMVRSSVSNASGVVFVYTPSHNMQLSIMLNAILIYTLQ